MTSNGGSDMLREMLYVYAVYQEKSFTKAAEKLYISQPALSARVKKAEQELQTLIFDRSTTPISLTKEGECYIQYAEKIMALQQEMKDHFRTSTSQANNELRLGGSAFFCSYIFPPIVKKFQKLYPNVIPLWMEGKNIELVDKLQDGTIDFFLEVDQIQSKEIESCLWGREKILLAVPASLPINRVLHDFAFTAEEIHDKKHLEQDVPAVRMEVFKNEDFIFLREGNDTYSRGMKICEKAGFIPHIVMKVDSLMTSYLLATEEHGVAFIRDAILFFADMTDRLLFYIIDDVLTERDIHLYCQKRQYRTVIASAFLKYLKEVHGL